MVKSPFQNALQILEKENQIFCVLHNSEYLGNNSDATDHSCIACNLNGAICNVTNFLKYNDHTDIEYSSTGNILFNYLLVERLTLLFKIVGISYEWVEENWPILIEIRKWANFIKHPKGFLLTHHPEYSFEGETLPSDKKYTIVTYKDVVEPLYKREDEAKYKQTFERFANKQNIIVIVPNPERWAKEVIVVCYAFIEKIKLNEHFKEILKKNTVIENYIF